MQSRDDTVRSTLSGTKSGEPPEHGEWSVYRLNADGTRTLIESDLPEEIARQMVADYAAEGDTTLEAVEE